jgi:hypothetical protein
MVEELIGAEENLEPAWAYETYPNTDRAKNYTLVVYPDDMPEDWLEIMQQDMYDMVISPYHDKDVNPDGTKKKPHYHILVSAGSSWIRMSMLAEWGRKLKGIARPQKCSNPKGLVRYMTHIDNPEKYQYNRSEIKIIGQYDIEPYFKSTIGEDRETRKEIMHFIIDNNIMEFADLVEYCLEHNDTWDDYLANNTLYIKNYVSSRRYRDIERKRERELAKMELLEKEVEQLKVVRSIEVKA